MAEGVFRHLSEQPGIDPCFEAESAGTVPYQAGSSPDPRAVKAADRHGIDISGIRSRCIHSIDLAGFDVVCAMDRENYEDLFTALGGAASPALYMMSDFATTDPGSDIEDPYYGTQVDFDRAMTRLVHCSEGLLSTICRQYGLEA